MSFTINIQADAAEALKRHLDALHDALMDRSGLNQANAEAVSDGVRQHLRSTASSHHRTASRLGAAPTGYLSQAAQNVTPSATGSAGTATIASDALAQVNGPVVIRPTGQWLAIPCDARSYGKKLSDFGDTLDFFVIRPDLACWVLRKKPRRDAPRKPTGPAKPHKPAAPKPIQEILFWGKKSVTLPQDTTLLPTDQEVQQLIHRATSQHLEAAL